MASTSLLKKMMVSLFQENTAPSPSVTVRPAGNPLQDAYIGLLKKALLNDLYVELETTQLHALIKTAYQEALVLQDFSDPRILRPDLLSILTTIKGNGDSLVLNRPDAEGVSIPAPELRNYTEWAHTMVGRARLDNLQHCIETVLAEQVPGDFIETGIWRGGSCIFMRGLLKAHGVTDRIIWAADSFEGVPPPTLPEDSDFDLSKDVLPVLAVSLEEVRALFQRYDLLDDQVRFLKGWFKDTLGTAPIRQLAVLRLDGDLYESTMDALVPLYDKVSPGGFIIVDDYYSCPPCAQAITDFREKHGITDPLIRIDNQSLYWRKSA